MWNKLKSMSQLPAVKALKTFCGDPVQLYSVFIIMTAMYYYHKSFTWLYTILALGISFVLMRFYDFVAKKRLIGPVCYLIFMGLGLYAVSLITHLGEQSYPLTFFVWFLTPQGVVDFSLIYTIAVYMLMIGFITSAVYYFAKTRYRMVMQLIIMLIPLSLYAKEGLHMPALLVILLLSSFFLLMVYCRQLRETAETRLMNNFHSSVSVALYVAAFSVTAAIIPKPQFQADREFIDNAMAYSTWSDVLMNAISMFTESTDNTAAVSNNARTLYYAASPEALRLRTQSYTYYKENDSWNVVYEYDRPDLEYEEPLTYQPRALTQAILDAAASDAAFAETYHLADLAGTELPPQEPRSLSLFSAWYNMPFLPSPTRTTGITGGDVQQRFRSANGAVMASVKSDGSVIEYYSDSYIRTAEVKAVLSRLDHAHYAQLLEDAAQILAASDPGTADFLQDVRKELEYADRLLDTANRMDYHSESIDALAADITAGLDSDLEKALAIEQYFTEQGYIYDLSYKKQPGDNIDTFLTASHVGVCYEYATAMVLLCRSAGLPARYMQGFSLSEPYDTQLRTDMGNIRINFLIKMRDAHAFPEVYISGYGWVSFEPTVASEEEDSKIAENLNVARWGYVLLVLTLLAIGIWAALPYLRENRFRRKLPAMAEAEAASAVFCRMRSSLKLDESTTVRELKQTSSAFFTDDSLFAALDTLLYDPTRHSSMTSSQLAETYIRWQAQRKVYEKEEKKLRKEQKKHHVNT